jgi:hypothetical protein
MANVLGELRQEVQRRKDLDIPLRSGCDTIPILVRKSPAGLFLGFVDNGPGSGYLDQTGQTQRAPGLYRAKRSIPFRSPAGRNTDGYRAPAPKGDGWFYKVLDYEVAPHIDAFSWHPQRFRGFPDDPLYTGYDKSVRTD